MEFAFLSVVELGRLLRQKKTSATELATYCLDRLERLGPRLNAVVTVSRERALAEAAEADREIRRGKWRGALHGIPYGVKDLLAAKGYPTTWGAEPYRQQKFDSDATVVERLGAAGAVLVGKLAMVELAGGMGYNQANASFTGPGRTPWNPEYWSGGSSSGPGAAVAAGLVPFTIGSETSGSILTPAAYCGVTGLRPTYGLVSRHGAMALAWTMDKLGPLGRSAEDCAIVLAAIAGRDAKDPSSVARGFQVPSAPNAKQRFRVAIPKGADKDIQPEVAANFRAALKVLADRIDVVEGVELPDLPYGAVAGMIIAAEGACAFAWRNYLLLHNCVSENDNKRSALYRYVTNLRDTGEYDFDLLQIAAVVYLKKLDELHDDRRARRAADQALAERLESRSAQLWA